MPRVPQGTEVVLPPDPVRVRRRGRDAPAHKGRGPGSHCDPGPRLLCVLTVRRRGPARGDAGTPTPRVEWRPPKWLRAGVPTPSPQAAQAGTDALASEGLQTTSRDAGAR